MGAVQDYRQFRAMAFGPVEENAKIQLDRCLERGGPEAFGVLCADHHKGYSMPIGGVIASKSVVMPAGRPLSFLLLVCDRSNAEGALVQKVTGEYSVSTRYRPIQFASGTYL